MRRPLPASSKRRQLLPVAFAAAFLLFVLYATIRGRARIHQLNEKLAAELTTKHPLQYP